LSKVRKLLEERHPLWTPGELEYQLNHILANQIHYETVARLIRVKDKQLQLPLMNTLKEAAARGI
jgi:hypothetical protein